ncbi:MAG: hypothetical protein OXF86_11880 [Caldilineaceae bacterium]|nr:hypothetical protein [Caldilineaceae bacterium]
MEVWEANVNATDGHFDDFTLSMFNILTQLQAFESNRRNLVGISRSVSVELRKLLLHNGLLQRCVRRPRLQPLIRPDRLKGDPFEDIFEMPSGSLTLTKLDEPMAGAHALVELAPMKHTTVIHPLYGLCFQNDSNQWVSESPFDEGLLPIRLDRWLKQSVLQIDSDIYDMRDLLSEVANTQGAHSDHQRDTIRQQIHQHFRGTYLNIFILWAGIYLYNQFSASVSADSSLQERIAKVHPDIREETYRVDAMFTFGRDQFTTHGNYVFRPVAVTQQLPIVGGVPERGPGLLPETPIISRFEVSVPAL